MNKSTSKPGSPKLVPSVNFAHHSYVCARSRREEVALPDPIDGARWIPLAGGRFALVDEVDYERVQVYNWCSYYNGNTWYAQSDYVALHHFILGTNTDVDHINRNGLDNRRCNLRHCTKSQNCINRRKRVGSSSVYKGVSYARNVRKWHAEITPNRVRINLGYYTEEIDAAKAYDQAALNHFGEFATLNFPVGAKG